MPLIQMLCPCGWGDLCHEVEDGDLPVCPVCGYEFPEVELDDSGAVVGADRAISRALAE